MKKTDKYDKAIVSLSAFMDEDPVWIRIIQTCFFLPVNEQWKIWSNPWGTVLQFKEKNENPKVVQENVDEENLCIWDMYFFQPLDKAQQRAIYAFGGVLKSTQSQWIYLYDGQFIKLHSQGKIWNPMHLGFSMVKNHLRKADNIVQDLVVPETLNQWEQLFNGKPEEVKQWLK